MVQRVHLLLDRSDDLYATASGADDGYFSAVEVVAFFVGGRVHEFAFEGMQTFNIRPFPVVQDAAGVDEEFGTVFNYNIFFEVADLKAPESG